MVDQSQIVRPLKPGIYAPVPTFFLPDTEDIDIASFEAHVHRVATAGVVPLLAGTMGEGHHLSPQERIDLITAARRVLDAAGLQLMPIVAGTGAGSTRETVRLSQDAALAGADYVIVIASGYFAGALAPSVPALKAFWSEVAEKSPIPVIIYNYPAASGGIDLDSDLILQLAQDCPNICGVKLTCGNVGKLTRISDVASQPAFDASRRAEAPFLVLGGYADFLLASAIVRGHGAITGLANVAPHATAKLFRLSDAAVTLPSHLAEAQKVQGIIARADYTISKAGIAGTKGLLKKLYGYGGAPRKPLLPMEPNAFEVLWAHPHTQDLVQLERELTPKASDGH